MIDPRHPPHSSGLHSPVMRTRCAAFCPIARPSTGPHWTRGGWRSSTNVAFAHGEEAGGLHARHVHATVRPRLSTAWLRIQPRVKGPIN